MTIDSEAKRRRVAGLPPLPDGVIDESDRAQIAGIYFIPGQDKTAIMPRARYLPFDLRSGSFESEDRLLPVSPVTPTIQIVIPSKKITVGDRLYPFAGFTITGPSEIASARWRRDGGAWNAISIGAFTDILSALRFVNEVINLYAQFFYEVEITDELGNVAMCGVDAVSNITTGVGKSVARDVKFRPFADSILAEDPTQISNIFHSVAGDTTIAKTVIERQILFTGTHDGVNNSAVLFDSTRDFTNMGIVVNRDIIENLTDGSNGLITALTANIITASMQSGAENDFDTDDSYRIVDGSTLDIAAKKFELSFAAQGIYLITLYVVDQSASEGTGIVTARVS